MNSSIVSQIKHLIENGEVEQAISMLLKYYSDTTHDKQVRMLASRFRNLEKKRIIGADEQNEQELNRITYSILSFLDNLSVSYPIKHAPFMAEAQIKQFTGRTKEIKKIENILLVQEKKSVNICGIVGQGGVGKSSLAAHFATIHRDKFPDGVFWIRVDDETPEEAASKIAFSLNERIDNIKNRSYAQVIIQKLLENRNALIIFDNADGNDVEDKIKYMLPGGISVSIIITTRNILLPGSFGADQVALDCFSEKEGLELFTRVLGKT